MARLIRLLVSVGFNAALIASALYVYVEAGRPYLEQRLKSASSITTLALRPFDQFWRDIWRAAGVR